jgi:outer membrane protein assembly factor BamB
MTRRSLLLSPLSAAVHPDVQVRNKPRALTPDAITHDWTRFLGPTMNGVSTETKISRKLPPPLVWEMKKGTGYTSPAIQGDRLVYLHRNGGQEFIECLHPETGARHWQSSYPTGYTDRYGYNNGPRSSPVIDGDRVYTLSAQGVLHCVALESGRVLWKRNVNVDYKVPQDFFGTAGTPLIEGGAIVLNVGAPEGPCVVALDKSTGKELWRAGKEWGPSYASPMPATIHGRKRVMVLAGGESQPATGGLMLIDPANGKVDFSFPFRSRSFESVNASCPVSFDDNKIFVSASYRAGGALIEVQPDFSHKELWRVSDFGMHFSTPLYRNGYLYGFEGRNEPDASLACLDVATGKVIWREVLEWNETLDVNGESRTMPMSPYRGSILQVDGGFLCLGERGHLLWLDLSPKGVKILGRTWLFFADQTWALPVLSRGLLYVSQNTRDPLKGSSPRLLCYDVRG